MKIVSDLLQFERIPEVSTLKTNSPSWMTTLSLSWRARAGLTLPSADEHPDIVDAIQEVYKIVDANDELFAPPPEEIGIIDGARE